MSTGVVSAGRGTSRLRCVGLEPQDSAGVRFAPPRCSDGPLSRRGTRGSRGRSKGVCPYRVRPWRRVSPHESGPNRRDSLSEFGDSVAVGVGPGASDDETRISVVLASLLSLLFLGGGAGEGGRSTDSPAASRPRGLPVLRDRLVPRSLLLRPGPV